jgi:trimeric autotransporter adhesin
MAKSNKGRKLFATSATAALVASAIVPVASAAQVNDFNSVSSYAQEAVQDLVDRGVITGDEKGNFQPKKTVSRAEAAKILTEALGLEVSGSINFSDVKAGAWYYDAIAAAVSNKVFEGQGAGKFNPSGNLTRSEAAKILVEAFDLEGTASLSDFKDAGSVKAWAKESLEIAVANGVLKGDNGNLKPNDAITKQDFAVMFYRTENLDKEPTTPDVSQVLPTAISFEETSIQGTFGEKVTLKAKVAVASGESAANIPVKFDIFHEKLANDTTIVPQLTETVVTDANGVATYTYTRSQGVTDTVNAYATGKPALKAAAKVYWVDTLAIKDVTEAKTLANGEQKVYQITGAKNEVVYVAFKENLNVAPEKAVRGVEFLGLATTGDTASAKFAYEYTTGGFAVGVVKLDGTGKANLVLTGEDASVTPIAFVNNDGTDAKYDATALQATASTVKFEKESVYDLSLVAEGVQSAAVRGGGDEIGGRDYVATLKTTAGKPIANATVKVTFEEPTSNNLDTLSVFDAKGNAITATGDTATFELKTDKDGKVKFTVTQSKVDSFATPIVFLETGSKPGLDAKDIQVTSEITYFRAVRPSDYTSQLVLTDAEGDEVTTFGSNDEATFAYQLSDQNGKPRSYGSATTVQFTVKTDASAVTVKVAGQPDVSVPAYSTKTVVTTIAAGSTSTEIIVSGNATTARVTATPTNSGLSGLTSVTKSATFLSGASTAYFSVADTTKTTADSVTLTFSEAVAANEIIVVYPAGGTTTAQNGEKGLIIYFNTVKPTTVNNEFTIYYKGKSYTFVYEAATGKVTLKR